MTQGFIVLGLLAAVVAFSATWLVRKMGLSVSSRMWLTVATGFALLVLIGWATSRH